MRSKSHKFSICMWLTRSVNHSMPYSKCKLFILEFITVNRTLVVWFTEEPGFEPVGHFCYCKYVNFCLSLCTHT